MTKRMLIDATQPEETRVAVLENDRLDTYDFDSSIRKQIKGNIFLAKVTRVEPSLQACFVEYGGNRQGFLAFTEIHPDYYRIPVEDRQALLAEEAAEWDEDEDDLADEKDSEKLAETVREQDTFPLDADDLSDEALDAVADHASDEQEDKAVMALELAPADALTADVPSDALDDSAPAANLTEIDGDPTVERVGGEEEEGSDRRGARRLGKLRRRYKIQEVIKRRQIMLVQATKEERGAKGAAMTTYISLPGRYCVLMPNSPRGGGVSRKITDPQARRKMKDLLSELEVPNGMSVILRTAGMTRTRQDIKRDLEYLLRLWDEIRRETMKSEAPALIYEEADIFKRTIRDLYTSETKEVIVSGPEGFKKVKTFMRQMVPLHAKRVLYYRDPLIPLFQRYGVEPQIANVFNPRVELKSGGYIIINPTEALVSIDVNSGRATRERHIDDTALKTNMEAAEEVARQLRLRDLGGLVVVDFIDMESSRHNAKVERKLRDSMAEDRARIEIGRISAFGLLELSRQRLHPSLTETHFQPCTHCNGTGMTRTVDSAAVVVMRAIEAEAARGRSIGIVATVPQDVALYLLNHKRDDIGRIEECFGCRVSMRVDDKMCLNDMELTTEKGTPKPRRQVELLPVPALEGSDDDYITAAEEADDGEQMMFTQSDADDAQDEDGDAPRSSRRRSSSRNSSGSSRNSRGRGRSRSKDNGDMAGDESASGEARIIPITVSGQENGEVAEGEDSDAIQNPTNGEGRSRSRRGRGGRHPYRRRRNNGDRQSATGEDNAAPSETIAAAAPQGSAEKESAVKKTAARRPRRKPASSTGEAVANDTTPSDEPKKKGWWQKLID